MLISVPTARSYQIRTCQCFSTANIIRGVRKIENSGYYLHVLLSVRMEQLGSHLTDTHQMLYLRIFRKSVQKIRVVLKSNKNNGYFARRLFTCRWIDTEQAGNSLNNQQGLASHQ
jgi:hypothetical protein